jgi:hypothetical protein
MGANLALYKHSWLLHDKYLIVDQSNAQSDPLVLTGSHNWSNNGNNRNDENTVIVHNAVLANQYYQDFMGRWCEREGLTCTLSGTTDPLQGSLSIYPNPNNGEFVVSLEASVDETASVALFDLTGKQVYAQSTSLTSGINKVQVKTSGLAKGMYFVRVLAAGAAFSQRVMVE